MKKKQRVQKKIWAWKFSKNLLLCLIVLNETILYTLYLSETFDTQQHICRYFENIVQRNWTPKELQNVRFSFLEQ